MQTGYVLLATIAVPLLAALALVAVPSRYPNVVRVIAVATGFALFGLSTYAFFAYQVENGEQFQFQLRWDWIENVGFLGDQGITLHLGIDGIGAPMVLLTGIVAFAGTLVSWKIDYRNKDFFILFMVLVSGVFGVFTSLDLFFWFFFYELAVLPMYLLIGVWGASSVFPTFVRTKEYGAMKLTLYLVAGSVLVWIAILAFYVEANTFNVVALEQFAFTKTFQNIFFPMV